MKKLYCDRHKRFKEEITLYGPSPQTTNNDPIRPRKGWRCICCMMEFRDDDIVEEWEA